MLLVKANESQSIFDLALQVYGSVDTSVKLFLENTDVIDTIDEQDLEGLQFQYEEGFKALNVPPLRIVIPNIPNLAQTYEPTDFQTIFDISLMLDGDLSKVVERAHNSTLNNINTQIDATDRFTYTPSLNAIVEWRTKNKIVFQTKTPLEGNVNGAFDKSFDQLAFN